MSVYLAWALYIVYGVCLMTSLNPRGLKRLWIQGRFIERSIYMNCPTKRNQAAKEKRLGYGLNDWVGVWGKGG
ncbi:hypothetical protein V8F20_003566 [Naviculisporaceae sp. PSN 640]